MRNIEILNEIADLFDEYGRKGEANEMRKLLKRFGGAE